MYSEKYSHFIVFQFVIIFVVIVKKKHKIYLIVRQHNRITFLRTQCFFFSSLVFRKEFLQVKTGTYFNFLEQIGKARLNNKTIFQKYLSFSNYYPWQGHCICILWASHHLGQSRPRLITNWLSLVLMQSQLLRLSLSLEGSVLSTKNVQQGWQALGLTFLQPRVFIYFLNYFIVVQLQLSAFSPPPQPNPPFSLASTFPLGFVHVSFISSS